MFFYELNGQLRKGFPVTLDPDPRVVIGGDTDRRVVLPLGRSLKNLIVGDKADRREQLLLLCGDLQEGLGGMVLTQQLFENAKSDERALVAVNFPWHDPQEGERVEHRAVRYQGKPKKLPQILEDRLLLFLPGEEVETSYVSRVSPQAMRLRWTGTALQCRRAPLEQQVRR
jgi:hypothetical protein